MLRTARPRIIASPWSTPEDPAKQKTISKATRKRLFGYPRNQRHKCARYKCAFTIVIEIASVLLCQ